MTTKIISRALTGFLMLLMLAPAAFAQETTSAIRGKILDINGQPVVNASSSALIHNKGTIAILE